MKRLGVTMKRVELWTRHRSGDADGHWGPFELEAVLESCDTRLTENFIGCMVKDLHFLDKLVIRDIDQDNPKQYTEERAT